MEKASKSRPRPILKEASTTGMQITHQKNLSLPKEPKAGKAMFSILVRKLFKCLTATEIPK
jgi:hypothetical protein